MSTATPPGPLTSTFTSEKHGDKSGWRVGDLLYYDSFDDLNGWSAEGNLSASAEDGHLLIECGEANEDRGNVWSKQAFTSPYYFEFRYRKLSGTSGLCLIFWNARTIDGTEFLQVERHWEMPYVIDGNMESYHISYSRGGTGVTNFHKNPGFHDYVQDMADPLADPGEDWHTIGVYQNGSHMMFYENGERIHDIDERVDYPTCACLRTTNHISWNIEDESGSMCPGLDSQKVYTEDGPVRDVHGRPYTYRKPEPGVPQIYTSGHIGFRHQNGVTLYDDFRVYSLTPPEG